MNNNLKELKGFEENYFINIIANNNENNIEKLRTKLNQKLEKIRIAKSQIKMLKIESLDLNEEIVLHLYLY